MLAMVVLKMVFAVIIGSIIAGGLAYLSPNDLPDCEAISGHRSSGSISRHGDRMGRGPCNSGRSEDLILE